MKINRITLENFGSYEGEATFETREQDGRNIILIGGKNGAGKTTFFESVKLCMFGHQFEGKPLSAVQYQQHIRDCQNKISVKEGDTRYYLRKLCFG